MFAESLLIRLEDQFLDSHLPPLLSVNLGILVEDGWIVGIRFYEHTHNLNGEENILSFFKISRYCFDFFIFVRVEIRNFSFPHHNPFLFLASPDELCSDWSVIYIIY